MTNMTTMPFFYRFREAVATLPSLLILTILILAGVQQAVKITPHTDNSTVQIALSEPEPPAPPVVTPPPPAPPQVVKPTPVAQIQPVRQQPAPQPTIAPEPLSSAASAEVAAPTPISPPQSHSYPSAVGASGAGSASAGQAKQCQPGSQLRR
ncbi:hypothetical protein [Collimonas sp.]|uniref:hypothetical protein n=1 Tax=Collimonas sp. TaxID=1963772 RepID=UPI0037BE2245